MNRDEFKKLVIEFKKSLDYLDRETDNPNCLLFTKGEIQELVYIYEPDDENQLRKALSEIARKYERIPKEIGRIFLSTVPLGRPPECVTENGFKYQVPVWFFDREFSIGKQSTPLKNLEAQVSKYENERIPQPYNCDGEKGRDLLETLFNELQSIGKPLIKIILAPAGYGKTVLMASLYSKLREKFYQDKQRQKLSLRPLIMLPGHIGKASDLVGLINNFIGSEYVFGDASLDTFKFWINNNFAIWLLDGIEEVLLRNPEESMYELLNEYIGKPGTINPQIIIAIRKSLFAASPQLKEYIDEWKDCIKVYELKEWDNEQKRMYFEKNLTIPPQEKRNFITDVENSRVLNQLCNVPYFCSLIANLKNTGQFRSFNDKEELVKYSFERICDREYDKGLDRDIFSIYIQKEILSEIGGESFSGNPITKELLKDWVELYTENMGEDYKQGQVNCFLRHALFTQIEDKIDFTQEIMKEYLEAEFLLNKLQANNVIIVDEKEIEYESFLLGYLIKHIPKDINWAEILNKIISETPCSKSEEAIGFRNIFKILTKSVHSNSENIIRDFTSCKNLGGLKFENLNMVGFNFSSSNLESVLFEKCNLEKTNFDGCYFKNTQFINCNLKNAKFKGCTFVTINIDSKRIEDKKEIIRTLYKLTETEVDPQNEPCQALINTIELLKKLARKPKGGAIPIKFLKSTKCPGGVPSQNVIEGLIREKILLREDSERVKLNVKLYESIKNFISAPASENLPEIKNLLDNICPDTAIGCKHLFY